MNLASRCTLSSGPRSFLLFHLHQVAISSGRGAQKLRWSCKPQVDGYEFVRCSADVGSAAG